MQRKGVAWRCVLRQRRIPGDSLGRADQVQPGGCQGGHVQRLAYVARGIGSICVLMKKGAASGKIEQRHTSQQCQPVAQGLSSENSFLRTHWSTLHCSSLDGRKKTLVAKLSSNPLNGLLDRATIPA
jgi:hypothetical protein